MKKSSNRKMTAFKMVRLPPKLNALLEQAAEQAEQSVSEYMREATRQRLAREGGTQ